MKRLATLLAGGAALAVAATATPSTAQIVYRLIDPETETVFLVVPDRNQQAHQGLGGMQQGMQPGPFTMQQPMGQQPTGHTFMSPQQFAQEIYRQGYERGRMEAMGQMGGQQFAGQPQQFGQPGQQQFGQLGQMRDQLAAMPGESSRETAQDLVGRTLRDITGEQVGEVTNVALGQQGQQIEELVVELPDGKLVGVSVDEVNRNLQTNCLVAQMSATELENMPEFDYQPQMNTIRPPQQARSGQPGQLGQPGQAGQTDGGSQ